MTRAIQQPGIELPLSLFHFMNAKGAVNISLPRSFFYLSALRFPGINASIHLMQMFYLPIFSGSATTNFKILPVVPVGPATLVTARYISPFRSCPNPFR